MSKRLASAAVAAALAACMLASLAGCGDDARQAQDLMASADGLMMENWKAVGEVSKSTDDLISWLSGALAAGAGIDQGGFDEEVADIREQVAAVQSQYEKAASGYRRLVDMEAPGGYTRYGTLKLREITAATALLNELEGFLIKTSERMSKTGIEPAWFDAEVKAYRARYDELYRKVVDLGLKATALRERSGFGQQGPLPAASPSSP